MMPALTAGSTLFSLMERLYTMRTKQWIFAAISLLAFMTVTGVSSAAWPVKKVATRWQATGWGGGGFYWSAAFDPAKNGAIYMGGDVLGAYKSDDLGKRWRFINNGMPTYGVYDLAADPHSNTVYAGMDTGMLKSTDGGGHWKLLPHTGSSHLDLVSQRSSVGGGWANIAIDPAHGQILYVGSGTGSIYKTTNGGADWTAVYKPLGVKVPPNVIQLQIGGVNGAAFGGFWMPLRSPVHIKAAACRGLQFSFRATGAVPGTVMLQLTAKNGTVWRSRNNLATLFGRHGLRPVLLTDKDFELDPGYVQSHQQLAKTLSSTPDWPQVDRLDFVCVNNLLGTPTEFGNFSYVLRNPVVGSAKLIVARNFAKNRWLNTYGNAKVGPPPPSPVRCVVTTAADTNLVVAAAPGHGVLISTDGGATWHQAAGLPRNAVSVAAAPSDARVIYAAFATNVIYKSTNQGKTWTHCAPVTPTTSSISQVLVAPKNADHVYAVGNNGWTGYFYYSLNAGATWHAVSSYRHVFSSSPSTFGARGNPTAGFSALTCLTINPFNPQQLFMSGNWHDVFSNDGGRTWKQADRGADISVVYDIRFYDGRVYTAVMDEGTFSSKNDGRSWRKLWPAQYSPAISGQNWRLAVSAGVKPGQAHIVAAVSPWNVKRNGVIVSNNGGHTYKMVHKGLPKHQPTINTMWGTGYARALAADPANPKVLYLGIDGNPGNGSRGGGIFRSTDGGYTWHRLANQPGSRRMFFGLAVDPTDPQRLYWGACGQGGGLWRSDNAGRTWKRVFSGEKWVFNVMVTKTGTVYCPGQNLWRSTDHGRTWKELTHFTNGGTIIGLAYNPAHQSTVWFSDTNWGPLARPGGVYRTTNGGKTWENITGDLPYRKPLILRYDSAAHQLWAGGVGLFKLRQ